MVVAEASLAFTGFTGLLLKFKVKVGLSGTVVVTGERRKILVRGRQVHTVE